MLEELLRTKKVSDDPLINKKLYSLFLQQFKENAVRNDAKDLTPHIELTSKMPPFISMQAVYDSRPQARNL
jgi:hypothetical protein